MKPKATSALVQRDWDSAFMYEIHTPNRKITRALFAHFELYPMDISRIDTWTGIKNPPIYLYRGDFYKRTTDILHNSSKITPPCVWSFFNTAISMGCIINAYSSRNYEASRTRPVVYDGKILRRGKASEDGRHRGDQTIQYRQTYTGS